MSLGELTRNAFQSGLAASKWLSLCKLFISRELSHASRHEVESELSNSVLVLFRNYPGDHELQAYLKYAIQDGTLTLAAFVSTFLSAARSRELHNTATLDTLCKIALGCHYSSGMPPIGSLVPFAEPPAATLRTVSDAMALLQTAYSLPPSQFRQLTASASELLILLLSTVSDVSQISHAQAMVHFSEASAILELLRLTPDIRHVLENFVLSLTLVLGDDAKAAREAQMMHTLQLALGKGDIVGHGSGTDIITCSLLLHTLVLHRADDFGSGDGDRAVVLLIALIRWASWTPTGFYTQLFLSTITCLSQQANAKDGYKNASLWRAFIVGRLPRLLSRFEKVVDLEGTTESDWRTAMQIAVASILQHTDLLQQCDSLCQHGDSEHSGASTPQRTFLSEFLHGLQTVGLVDQAFVSQTNPLQQNEFHPKVQTEAQEHGSELEPYLETKLAVDIGMEDIAPFIEKLWRDPCSHATYAELVRKRFVSSASSSDLESLGHLCKILYTHEHALDILALHVKLADLVAHALVIIEDYDCETVGNPQTAVTHIGNVVFFLQITLGRYHLGKRKFTLGDRKLTADLLDAAGVLYRVEDLKGEDASAFNHWHKALFDSQSEGIDDSVLRATRPRSILKLAATVLSHAIQSCMERKMEKSVLDNGIQYFLGPLLIWTVGGVIKALLAEASRRAYLMPQYLEVLQSFLGPSSCPPPMLRLLASTVLRTLSSSRPPAPPAQFMSWQFNPTPFRKVALAALGAPSEEPHPSPSDAVPGNPVLQAIRNALASARAGKAPYLDIDRCLHWMNPTSFLFSLWAELTLASAMGELEAPRRIATYVLTTPRTPRSPPLLPIFLHLVLPHLIASADHLVPPEQTMSVELLVSVVSSALTAALYVEWALLSVCKEQRLVLGQPALAMARRLGGDLRRRKNYSPTSTVIVERLTASSAFMTNFPTFRADF